MYGKSFSNIAITGIACAVPSKVAVSEEYIEQFGESAVRRFVESTGIRQRHVTNGKQTGSDLCYVAARELMSRKQINGEDVDALIFVTQFPDYKIPSTAYVLHHRLNIKKDCIVFDVNLGCSAFVNGVYFLSGLIESGTIKRALLLIGDVDMEYQNDGNISFSMMFGDAGSACIIEKGQDQINGMIRSDGSGYRTIITPRPGARFPEKTDEPLVKTMNGDDTFLFTITQVPKLFKKFYKEFDVNPEQYDYYILHQANLMIINQIARKLKVSPEKFPISLDTYGNTDGASIPVTIVKLCGELKKSQRLHLITAGFGIGLSWGIVSLFINSEDVLPMIVTDEYYVEGRSL